MTRPKADRPHRVCAWVTDEEYQRVAAIRQALQLTTRDMVLLAVYRMERVLREERQRQQ